MGISTGVGTVGLPQTSNKTIMPERMMTLAVSPLTKWKEDEILTEVQTQYGQSNNYMLRKKKTWSDYTRLYLNQFRKEQMPDSLGSKLIFTKFNEAYANFAADERTVEFEPRLLDDTDIVANTNAVATYDWDQFDGPNVWNVWLWDAMFYGFGVVDVSDWDKKWGVLRPRRQNPYLCFIDPLAVTLGQSRFFGRYEYYTYYDLINHPYMEAAKVKELARRNESKIQISGNINTNLDRLAKNILIGANNYEEPVMTNSYFEILCWYWKMGERTYRIWTDNKIEKMLGYDELKYNDSTEQDGTTDFPFVIKNLYKLPDSIMGIGVPDVIEDDHRADVRITNYLYEATKIDATPSFLYNYNALVNPRDLKTREVGKNVPTKVTPNGEMIEMPKSGAVNQATLEFLQLIQSRGDLAIGQIQMPSNATATSAAISKTRMDLIMSARAKEMTSADKRFWYVWLSRYRKHFKGGDKKLIKIVGTSGFKELKELKGKEFIPNADPDINVVSKLISEPKRVQQQQQLEQLLGPIGQVQGNVKEAVKRILYLMDMRKDDVTNLLPPTPHELRAMEENNLIDAGKMPLIHENDDDQEHISIHMRAEEGHVRDIHIQAHVLNYLRKQQLPDPNANTKEGKEAAAQTKKGDVSKILPPKGSGALAPTKVASGPVPPEVSEQQPGTGGPVNGASQAPNIGSILAGATPAPQQ